MLGAFKNDQGARMAKTVEYRLDGASFQFALGKKIDKAALYGYAERRAEKDGKTLARGVLLADGTLLPRTAIGYPKADDGGTPIEEPVAHLAGTTVEKRASSFDAPSEFSPIPLSQLALFAVRDVYPVQADVLPPVGLYQCTFNYMAGYNVNEARVLIRADGLAFLLVGVSKRSKPTELTVNYAFFEDDAEEGEATDELDFALV
jgi:hypothetical protein